MPDIYDEFDQMSKAPMFNQNLKKFSNTPKTALSTQQGNRQHARRDKFFKAGPFVPIINVVDDS